VTVIQDINGVGDKQNYYHSILVLHIIVFIIHIMWVILCYNIGNYGSFFKFWDTLFGTNE